MESDRVGVFRRRRVRVVRARGVFLPARETARIRFEDKATGARRGAGFFAQALDRRRRVERGGGFNRKMGAERGVREHSDAIKREREGRARDVSQRERARVPRGLPLRRRSRATAGSDDDRHV